MEELVHRPQSSFNFEYPLQRPSPAAAPLVVIEPPKSSPHRLAGEIPSLVTNANVLFKHAENDLGFALVRQALKIDSRHPEVLKQLARFHVTQKNWIFAAKTLEEVVKQDYSFENLAALAESYYLLDRDEEALAKYEEALSILMDTSPSLFNVYKNLGNIFCRLGDFHAAEENYFKAFTLDSRSDVLLVNLGTLEVQKSDFNLALEKFRSALEINPSNDKAWVGLAIVHDKMGDFDLARANIENAIDIAPVNRTAVHIFSAWATRDKRYPAGIEVLQNYLSMVEQDEEMSLALINLFCLTEQFDLAAIEIERVLLWNPQQEEVLQLIQKIPRLF
jgi:tetratricopeptide (TPR) repeat protein